MLGNGVGLYVGIGPRDAFRYECRLWTWDTSAELCSLSDYRFVRLCQKLNKLKRGAIVEIEPLRIIRKRRVRS